MAGKAQITLEIDVPGLRRESERLTNEVAERLEKLDVIKKKLAAVELLSPHLVEGIEQSSAMNGDDDKPKPLVDAIVEHLAKTGESLEVADIKRRMSKLGYADLLSEKPNAIYQAMFRLSQGPKPRVLKRGTKYRAPPPESPEGDTGASGAPARH